MPARPAPAETAGARRVHTRARGGTSAPLTLETFEREIGRIVEGYAGALAAADAARVKELRNEIGSIEFSPEAGARAREIIGSGLERIEVRDLPHAAGIYLLVEGSTIEPDRQAYVGCSVELANRYFGRFGYRSGNSNKTRARELADELTHLFIERLDVPSRLEERQALLGSRETYWYLISRAAGLLMRNAVGNLGAQPDNTEAWLVACRIADGELSLHFGIRDAAIETGIPASRIAPMFRGHQSQSNGYTFRYATEEEIATETPVSRDSDARMEETLLTWTRGGVESELRSRLAIRARGGRYDKARTSGFIGVTRTPGRTTWSAYYVNDPSDRSSPTFLGRAYPTPEAASAARESFLEADPRLRALNPRGGAKGTPTR